MATLVSKVKRSISSLVVGASNRTAAELKHSISLVRLLEFTNQVALAAAQEVRRRSDAARSHNIWRAYLFGLKLYRPKGIRLLFTSEATSKVAVKIWLIT